MATKILSPNEMDRILTRTNPQLKRRNLLLRIAHTVVLMLSLALITFISYDTFKNIPFLENRTYMNFQLIVCLVFLADFCLGIALAEDRRAFFNRYWFFLLISIPYLNIIEAFHIVFAPTTLYYIRFIPLVRGAYALMMVVGYFSSDRAISLIAQYAVILLSVIYFSSLIFYYVEKDTNSNVTTYWDALYWAFMNVDTVGSYITAESVIGKILSIILAVCGMMMLPLFTVYVTSRVADYNKRQRALSREFMQDIKALHVKHHGDEDDDDSDNTTAAAVGTPAAPQPTAPQPTAPQTSTPD